jgi:hypothetical protein
MRRGHKRDKFRWQKIWRGDIQTEGKVGGVKGGRIGIYEEK